MQYTFTTVDIYLNTKPVTVRRVILLSRFRLADITKRLKLELVVLLISFGFLPSWQTFC